MSERCIFSFYIADHTCMAVRVEPAEPGYMTIDVGGMRPSCVKADAIEIVVTTHVRGATVQIRETQAWKIATYECPTCREMLTGPPGSSPERNHHCMSQEP